MEQESKFCADSTGQHAIGAGHGLSISQQVVQTRYIQSRQAPATGDFSTGRRGAREPEAIIQGSSSDMPVSVASSHRVSPLVPLCARTAALGIWRNMESGGPVEADEA